DLLSDVMLNASFPPSGLQRVRQRTLRDLEDRQADPSQLVETLFTANVFPDHPLGRQPLGTADGVQAISRQDLMDQKERLWGAANMALVVIGRIRPDEAVERALEALGDTPTGAHNDRVPELLPRPDGPHMV